MGDQIPERKDFAKGKGSADPKVPMTVETCQALKDVRPLLLEYMKAMNKYHSLLTTLGEVGTAAADLLGQIAALHKGDLGEGVKQIAEIQKTIEGNRAQLAQTLMVELISPLTLSIDPDYKEVNLFDRNYKKKRSQGLSSVKKAEDKVNKIQKKKKKKPEDLTNALEALKGGIEEHDKMLAESLKEVVLMQRKKYCGIISAWMPVLQVQSEQATSASSDIATQDDYLRGLAESKEQLPQEAVDLIQSSTPTEALSRIQIAVTSGYYDESSPYSAQDAGVTLEHSPRGDYENWGAQSTPNLYGQGTGHRRTASGGGGLGGSPSHATLNPRTQATSPRPGATLHPTRPARPPAPNADQGGGGGSGPLKVRARYAYEAIADGHLTFMQGEIIDLIEEVNADWWRGEYGGQQGLFPAAYVEKMMRAGS